MLNVFREEFGQISGKAHTFVSDLLSKTESEFTSLRNDVISLHTRAAFTSIPKDLENERITLVNEITSMLSSIEEYWKTRFDAVSTNKITAPTVTETPAVTSEVTLLSPIQNLLNLPKPPVLSDTLNKAVLDTETTELPISEQYKTDEPVVSDNTDPADENEASEPTEPKTTE
jgi:hypothetical protein